MPVKFTALASHTVDTMLSGGLDANGQPPEPVLSEGGYPCRHCLRDIGPGQRLLLYSHRPFETIQPYAESGPIFLCADGCERHPEGEELPPILKTRHRVLIRGYTDDERICAGTGAVINTAVIVSACEAIFERPEVAFIHIRSVQNNCYFCRVERA